MRGRVHEKHRNLPDVEPFHQPADGARRPGQGLRRNAVFVETRTHPRKRVVVPHEHQDLFARFRRQNLTQQLDHHVVLRARRSGVVHRVRRADQHVEATSAQRTRSLLLLLLLLLRLRLIRLNALNAEAVQATRRHTSIRVRRRVQTDGARRGDLGHPHLIRRLRHALAAVPAHVAHDALQPVLGLLDLRFRAVYLLLNAHVPLARFLQLAEVRHHGLTRRRRDAPEPLQRPRVVVAVQHVFYHVRHVRVHHSQRDRLDAPVDLLPDRGQPQLLVDVPVLELHDDVPQDPIGVARPQLLQRRLEVPRRPGRQTPRDHPHGVRPLLVPHPKRPVAEQQIGQTARDHPHEARRRSNARRDVERVRLVEHHPAPHPLPRDARPHQQIVVAGAAHHDVQRRKLRKVRLAQRKHALSDRQVLEPRRVPRHVVLPHRRQIVRHHDQVPQRNLRPGARLLHHEHRVVEMVRHTRPGLQSSTQSHGAQHAQRLTRAYLVAQNSELRHHRFPRRGGLGLLQRPHRTDRLQLVRTQVHVAQMHLERSEVAQLRVPPHRALSSLI
eukprot:9483694-Pyramimonas_sp.AAC.4